MSNTVDCEMVQQGERQTIALLYRSIAERSASFLRSFQVIWPYRVAVSLNGETRFEHLMLAHDCDRCVLRVTPSRSAENGDGECVFTLSTRHASIKGVRVGEFFRVSKTGKLYHLPGFQGKERENAKNNAVSVESASDTLQAMQSHRLLLVMHAMLAFVKQRVKGVPGVLFLRDKLVQFLGFEKAQDLTGAEGVTFRFVQGEGVPSIYLECYDHGGIFDNNLNAEGMTYPEQVAGNYYADAYSVLLFLRLYELTEDVDWFDAAKRSWEFLERIYPNYLPSRIVWHHSDFKNAAILEVQARYAHRYPEFIWKGAKLVEDTYEPTNVYALRVHWKTLLDCVSIDHDSQTSVNRDLLRIQEDQTEDGLIHDNIHSYRDAHDLTYHQYSCACLAQAVMLKDDDSIREILVRAVCFTLKVFGPDGEPAYMGRASNNLHQSASAILAFHVVAKYYGSVLLDGAPIGRALLQAAYRTAVRMQRYFCDDESLPTGLNTYPELRMGWNHCRTPYNALAGYFLLRACDVLPEGMRQDLVSGLLPLEREFSYLAQDAHFAAISTGGAHLVIFAGCDESYGWSELVHRTGNAGIALFGVQRLCSDFVYPSLDYQEKRNVLVSDLPVINGQRPHGVGRLEVKGGQCVVLHHQYGGASLKKMYRLIQDGLEMWTEIDPGTDGTELDVQGLVKWMALEESLFRVVETAGPQCIEYRACAEKLKVDFRAEVPLNVHRLGFRVIAQVSNPKGYVTVVESQSVIINESVCVKQWCRFA